MKHTVITLVLAAMALASCANPAPAGRPCVPIVGQVLADKSEPYLRLKGFSATDVNGAITVIDEPARAEAFSRALLVADSHDNVSGKPLQDRLPDFSGEVICSIADSTNSPYSNCIADSARTRMRELTVCNLLHALDTSATMVMYGNKVHSSFLPAKVVVLSSPYSAAYGSYDLDSLCRATACAVPVIYPSRLALSTAIAEGSHCLGVIADSLVAKAGLYDSMLADLSSPKTVLCHTFPVSGADALKSFLDKYIAAGLTHPIGAVIVDDCTVSADAVAKSAILIRALAAEDSYKYQRLIPADFKVYSTLRIATDECYSLMRRNNIFTHNISFPTLRNYVTVEAKDAEASGCLATIGGYTITQYVQNQR